MSPNLLVLSSADELCMAILSPVFLFMKQCTFEFAIAYPMNARIILLLD